ncbi:MAG: hypothetical protein AB8B78_12985 [Polaribacter sp.]
MKNFKTQLVVTVTLFLAIAIQAQDHLMVLKPMSASVLKIDKTKKMTEAPLVKDASYSYKYKGGDVLVVFEGNYHYEFFNSKKHFIKSDLVWTNKDECYMIIKEFNLPNFPFKAGTKMKMEITKVKDGFVHYKSTLGGRTWKGKMKETKTKA